MTEDPDIEACVAAATACLSHLDAAADVWATAPETVEEFLRSAELARDRIDARVRSLASQLAPHARKARRAAELAEKATAALYAVRSLPTSETLSSGPDDAEEVEEAEQAAMAAVERALGSLRRAADAALH